MIAIKSQLEYGILSWGPSVNSKSGKLSRSAFSETWNSKNKRHDQI